MILHLFSLIFWAMISTLAITPIAIRVANRFQLIDQLNNSPHTIHQHPVPKAGTPAIRLGVVSLPLLGGNVQSGAICSIADQITFTSLA